MARGAMDREGGDERLSQELPDKGPEAAVGPRAHPAPHALNTHCWLDAVRELRAPFAGERGGELRTRKASYGILRWMQEGRCWTAHTAATYPRESPQAATHFPLLHPGPSLKKIGRAHV